MTSSPSRRPWRTGAARAAALSLAVALGSLALSGCAGLVVGGVVVGGAMLATDRRTSGAQVDDQMIELKSNGRMDEAFGDRARVNTTSYNRMVLLTGEVPNDADKTAAEQVVARIDNVQSVVNELRIGPVNTFGEKTKDAFVTAKVKTSLVDAKDLFANSIKVVTHRGTVYLMGRVTEREATRAAEVARGVGGVAKVVKVFEVVSEPELASTARKTIVRPDPPPASPTAAATAAPVAEAQPVRP